MALPDFDSAKHHIGLEETGAVGNPKGFLITGGYRSDPQRATAPSEFGGERDLLEPSVLSSWTQDDFSGGAFQEIFSNDPAMVAFTKNFLPNQIEKSARTVPPLVFWSDAGNPDASAALAVFASGNKVAVISPTQTSHYNIGDGTDTTSNHATNEVVVAAHDPTDNWIYVITKHDTTDELLLRRYRSGDPIETIGDFPAATDNADPKGLEVMGRDLIACLHMPAGGHVLYLCDVNDARTSTTFTRVGRLPGPWRDSCVYNGLIYILCTDREQRTAVYVWDGSQLLPVVEFPYNFIGRQITVYGGRLFVCGAGTDVLDADRYAELYEITGSSLRLVRTFAWEARAGFACPTTFYAMTVHEGLLWLGTDQGYLLAYDLTRDALWSRVDVTPAAETDGTLLVKFLLSTREKLFAWCDDDGGSGATSGDGFYRMASEDADLGGASYTSYIETSDFGPEPARDKRWSSLRVLTRYGVEPTLEASIDGGSNWSAVGGSSSGAGNLKFTDFDLADIDVAPMIRFRISFSKDVVAMSELIALTCQFLFLDSGKWTWAFTVNGADLVEELDGASLDQDTALIRSTLRGYWTNRTQLSFTDVDGVVSTVQLTDYSESQPIVGPALGDGSREAFYSVVLTEV